MRSRFAPAVVALAAVLLVSPSGAFAAIPDVTVLFKQAVRIVRHARGAGYRRAVVFEADGLTRSGRGTTSAAGIVSWRFVFRNGPAPHRTAASISLLYGPAPRGFGRPQGNPSPFLEDVAIRRAPRMTLTQAVSLLRRAGHRKRFTTVTLRNPLGPKRLNPEYIFGFRDGRFAAVDTVTRRVFGVS